MLSNSKILNDSWNSFRGIGFSIFYKLIFNLKGFQKIQKWKIYNVWNESIINVLPYNDSNYKLKFSDLQMRF